MYDVDLSSWFDNTWTQVILAPFVQILGTQFDWLWVGAAGACTLAWIALGKCARRRTLARHSVLYPAGLSVLTHSSSRVDYALFLAVPMLLTALGLAAWNPWYVASWMHEIWRPAHGSALDDVLGAWSEAAPRATLLLAWMLWVAIGDLSQYLTHLAAHRVPQLWQLHRLHHQAEVLSPFTGAREHPLLKLLDIAAYAAMVGAFLSILQWAAPETFEGLLNWETGGLAFGWYFAGFLTSHYHVPIRFGPLERVLVSPGYHWVHHLNEPGYFGKNLGHIFVVWDHLFGTYREPPPVFNSDRLGLHPTHSHSGTAGEARSRTLNANNQ